MAIKTPYKDAIGSSVPTRGAKGTYDSEPNLPDGMPGRSGGLLPEKLRDDIGGKVPSFVETGKSLKIGG